MKNILFVAFACLFISHFSIAQISAKRSIRLHNLGKDSFNLSFSEEYNLIEDSCAKIIRNCHFNQKQRKFFGEFKDVNAAQPEVIVSLGNYNSDGLKDGFFINNYLDGEPQAKGNFKQDKPDGKWEFYYPQGKPKLILEAAANEIQITDAWDKDGKKIIDKGNGKYSFRLESIVWEGKLYNGRPDGTWEATSINDRSNKVLVSEKFKNGQFKKGTGPMGDYTDSSRINLFIEAYIPLINAERMRISPYSCTGSKKKDIIHAHYADGRDAFTLKIKELLQNYLRTVNISPYNVELEIRGDVSTKGEISNLQYYNAFDDKIAFGLTSELSRLPFLEPATVDGKPIVQKIVFKFKFEFGRYEYSYRFLPIKIDN